MLEDILGRILGSTVERFPTAQLVRRAGGGGNSRVLEQGVPLFRFGQRVPKRQGRDKCTIFGPPLATLSRYLSFTGRL